MHDLATADPRDQLFSKPMTNPILHYGKSKIVDLFAAREDAPSLSPPPPRLLQIERNTRPTPLGNSSVNQ